MKKLLGILGVGLFSMAMFLNTNTTIGSNGDLDLASLIAINEADAECKTNGGLNGRCAQTGLACFVGATPLNCSS